MKIIKTPAEIDTRLKSFVVVADSETAMKNSIDIVREYGYEIKILDFFHVTIIHLSTFILIKMSMKWQTVYLKTSKVLAAWRKDKCLYA